MVVPSTTHKQFVQVVSAHNARVLLQFLFLLLAAGCPGTTTANSRVLSIVECECCRKGRKWNSHLKHNETTFTIQLFIYVVVKFFKLRALLFVLSMTKGSLLCVRAQQCAALYDKWFAALRSNAKMRCHAALCAITAHAHTMQHCVMFIDNDVKHGCQLPVIGSFPVSYTTKEVRWIGKAANNFKTSLQI